MPKNAYNDEYEEDQYNGDPSYNGRINTNKQKAEERMEEWLEGTFVEDIMPQMIPDVNFTESFSDISEIGEYKIDSDNDSHGYSSKFVEVGVSPEFFSYVENNGWDNFIKPFEEAASKEGFESNVYSRTDGNISTILFSITAYK